jgi:HPt (histidine-containing phosphotransfer) domain-containing protein
MSHVHDLTHGNHTQSTASTTFTLHQLKRNIKTELDNLPPFHKYRDVLRAEIDQIDDMIDRRR